MPIVDKGVLHAPIFNRNSSVTGHARHWRHKNKRNKLIIAEAGLRYDLVNIVAKADIPPDNDALHFIGYDISHPSGYSLLSWDLNFEKPAPEFFHQRENPDYHPLLLLIQKYFRPLLNNYRLFSTVEEATFFLNVASAMTEGYGAVWESTEYGAFSVVKIYMMLE